MASGSAPPRRWLTVALATEAVVAGDVVRARIDFSQAAASTAGGAIEWAAVQVHAHAVAASYTVSMPPACAAMSSIVEGYPALGIAGFPDVSDFAGRNGVCVFASTPCVVCRDATLDSDVDGGASGRSYSFASPIPANTPPSFRGQLVKYAYYLTVAARRAGAAKPTVVRVPIHVLVRPAGWGAAPAGGLPRKASGHSVGSPSAGTRDWATSPSGRASPPPSALSPTGGRLSPGHHASFGAGAAGVHAGGGGAAESPAQSTGSLPKVTFPPATIDPESLRGEATEISFWKGAAVGDAPDGVFAQGPDASGATGGVATSTSARMGVEDVTLAIDPVGMCARPHVFVGEDDDSAPLPRAAGYKRFNVGAGDRPLGTLSLLRSEYCPGDIVMGTVDFASASDPAAATCYQMCAQLVFEETVLHKSSGEALGGRVATTVATCQEFTAQCDATSFELRLPSDLPPAFVSHHVGVSWSLSFEFTIAKAGAKAPKPGAPIDVAATTTLRWRVPVSVVPSRPAAADPDSGDAAIGEALPWRLSAGARRVAM